MVGRHGHKWVGLAIVGFLEVPLPPCDVGMGDSFGPLSPLWCGGDGVFIEYPLRLEVLGFIGFPISSFDWVVGWLAGWLIGWLAGWLADWLVG